MFIPLCNQVGDFLSTTKVTDLVRVSDLEPAYDTGMVTRIRKGTRRRLFLAEWRESKDVSVEKMADRLEITRQSVYRWEKEQWRLDPQKIAAYAAALDLEPEDMWRPPGPRSLDGMVANAPEDVRERAIEMLTILLRTGTDRR